MITKQEYLSRMENLQRKVSENGLDLFIVSAFDSIYYLTGAGFEPLERPFFLLVRPERSPVLLVPKLDEQHMKKARNISPENIHTYWEYPAAAGRSWPDRLRDHVDDAQQIGVEPTLRQEIAQQLCGYSIRVEALVERLRLVKSEVEIEMIRRAARYADLGVEQLLAASYYGATVAEGFARTSVVTRRIIREVDDWDPLTNKVLMAVWAAPRSAQPHSVPDLNDMLCKGPHVSLVLTRVNGYAAESERTFFTKPPTPEMKKAFRAMLEARRGALAMIRPGVACAELDAKTSEFLRTEGYHGEDQRLHRTGHGLGLGNHEAPWIAEGSTDVLEENMVISVEPGVYLQGNHCTAGGYRHSDTVLVTKEGCELLTAQPTDLQSLTVQGWNLSARFRGWMIRRALRLDRKARVRGLPTRCT
jgi:Xaa-Pro dipeptidase